MGRKLVLMDEDTGEVLEVIATPEGLGQRAVHKAVMNHVHNTLGAVSDEQIREYVKEAVQASVTSGRVQAAVDKYVSLWLNEHYQKQALRKDAVEAIVDKLEVTVAVKQKQ